MVPRPSARPPDHEALGQAKSSSITLLTAEREALIKSLCRELHSIETDANFSLETLSHSLKQTRGEKAYQQEQLTASINGLDSDYKAHQEQHANYASKAEQTEARLAAEIARLCAVCDKLKQDAEQVYAQGLKRWTGLTLYGPRSLLATSLSD